MGERWSSATLKILDSMPSRTIGRNRGAILSQYYNRTLQLRMRRQSRPSLRDLPHSSRPSLRGYRVESDFSETDSRALVSNLQKLSVSDRVRMLRAMPLSMADKRQLSVCPRPLPLPPRPSPSRPLPPPPPPRPSLPQAARQLWYSWFSFLHSLQLWQLALKRVGGRFGTGVLSYFLFLKTLLFFNLFLFLVTGLFLVLPQAVHPPPAVHPPQAHQAPQRPASFSGLELLTGGGYFSDSVLYYGYYSDTTLNRDCDNNGSAPSPGGWRGLDCARQGLSYSMPLAYFFTIGTAFFITCIILVFSMSRSFGQSFRVEQSPSLLAMKAFCSWDFKVVKTSSVALMSENIGTQLRVGDQPTSLPSGLIYPSYIGSTVACALAVHTHTHTDTDTHARARTKRGVAADPQPSEAHLLALPVAVSLINLLLPGLFNAAGWMEEYDSPSVRNSVAIVRNLMLKVSLLSVLCFHWLGREATSGLQCWESFVGQELYRFLLMDFIFTLLDTLLGEFLWRLFSEKVLKKSRRPVFDIARNVLELIYGQTLAWLGVLFTPLLPGVQIIKLLLLFYIKMSSVMLNCQAPRKPYRASKMTTVFITLLCFPSFLGASVCVTYTMWSIAPSRACGPFRGLSTMMQAGRLWVEQLRDANPHLTWLATAHSYLVENPLFLFVAAGVFMIIIYFNSQVVGGQRKVIALLQEQIKNEGEDKKFLIRQLQTTHAKKRDTPARRSQQVRHCDDAVTRRGKASFSLPDSDPRYSSTFCNRGNATGRFRLSIQSPAGIW
uniref:Transmembrane channel-like protein n=1 Tax=Gadus morhua TaxID=8049 RepID=A0A8C5D190_GADMO